MFDRNACRCRALYHTSSLCNHTYTGVYRCFYFHTCSDCRSFCCKKRHCLTLHVGSHQRTVGIVILKEWDQCCRNREYHLRRHVHIIKFASLIFLCLFTITTGYILMQEVSFLIQWCIRLCYMIVVLFICCHIHNIFCNDRVHRICFVDLTIWSFNESIFVDSRISCKRVDQTDVRTFRCLDRTHSSIVRIVNVTDLKSCTVSGKTTRSKCRQTSLVSQLSKRVVLIHELRQLRRTKEFFHGCSHRLDIDQRLWRNSVLILCCHSFTNNSLQSGQTDSVLILEKLSNRTDTSVAQMIDIIIVTHSVFQMDVIVNRS